MSRPSRRPLAFLRATKTDAPATSETLAISSSSSPCLCPESKWARSCSGRRLAGEAALPTSLLVGGRRSPEGEHATVEPAHDPKPRSFREQLINNNECVQRRPQWTSSQSPALRMTVDLALRPRRNYFLEPDVKDDGGSSMVVPLSALKVSPTGSLSGLGFQCSKHSVPLILNLI
jgi:hypothetical protein